MRQEDKNRLGFVVMGLCNDFSYHIMLCAANDFMGETGASNQHHSSAMDGQFGAAALETIISNGSQIGLEPSTSTILPTKPCNPMSASTVLLADSLPAMIIQILYPILLVKTPVTWKVLCAILLAVCAFLITSTFNSLLSVILGTVAASMAYGLGESTFLSCSVFFGPGALVGWSIGTGCAGLASALCYALVRTVVSLQVAMQLALAMPLMMTIVYFSVLEEIDLGPKQEDQQQLEKNIDHNNNTMITQRERNLPEILEKMTTTNEKPQQPDKSNSTQSSRTQQQEPIKGHKSKSSSTKGQQEKQNQDLELSPKGAYVFQTTGSKSVVRFCIIDMFPYYGPMVSVYFCAYFINQGLIELMFFPDFEKTLGRADQYRWLQLAYQLGAFMTRCSVGLFRFPSLWLLGFLQPINVALCLAHTLRFITLPGFISAFALVFYVGVVSGLNYANTFAYLTERIQRARLPTAVGVVGSSNSAAVLLAAVLALPTHNKICEIYESLPQLLS